MLCFAQMCSQKLQRKTIYRSTCLLPFVVDVSMLWCNRAKPIGVHHNLVCVMIQLSWKELPGKQPAATLTVYKARVQKYNQLCIKVLYGHISHSWTWPTNIIMLLDIIAKIQDWHVAKRAIYLSTFLFSQSSTTMTDAISVWKSTLY